MNNFIPIIIVIMVFLLGYLLGHFIVDKKFKVNEFKLGNLPNILGKLFIGLLFICTIMFFINIIVILYYL